VTISRAISSKVAKEHTYHEYIISLSNNGSPMPSLRMLCPFTLAPIKPLELCVEQCSTVKVHFDGGKIEPYSGDIGIANEVTKLLLRSTPRHISQMDNNNFHIKFEPLVPVEEMRSWLEKHLGQTPVSSRVGAATELGLIRDMNDEERIYLLKGLGHFISSAVTVQARNPMDAEHCVKVVKLAKRGMDPRMLSVLDTPGESDIFYLPIERCTVDKLPLAYAQVAELLPSITQYVGEYNTTHNLNDHLEAHVGSENRDPVDKTFTSIVWDAGNYQTLTFLGYSCLSLYTTIALMSQNIERSEGRLSQARRHFMRYENLAVAAQHVGWDQYIRAEQFAYVKSRLEEIRDRHKNGLSQSSKPSNKSLGDAMVTLLGAAWLDGGEEALVACLSIFMPQLPWKTVSECRALLLSSCTTTTWSSSPAYLVHLEALVKHTFENTTLLSQAVTHSSYIEIELESSVSFNRLELCGDSVLDLVIRSRILRHSASLEIFEVQRIVTALTSADFLGFTCLNYRIPPAQVPLPAVSSTGSSSSPTIDIPTTIWHHMRHHFDDNTISFQRQNFGRFSELEPEINAALLNDKNFPWALLATLGPRKIFSDLIESVTGAIYIDSGGSLPACEEFLTASGILPYLDRVLIKEVDVTHPKIKLESLVRNGDIKYVATELGGDSGEPNWQAEVFIGGKLAAVSTASRTKGGAELKAADIAISQWLQTGYLSQEICPQEEALP
jgi:dsRNA-specific ribonuclease